MPKRTKALITIISEEEYKYEVYLNDDTSKKYLYYVEDDDLKTVNIYDYQNYILERDNEKIHLKIKFTKDKVTENQLLLKDIDEILDLKVMTNDIIVDNDKIEVIYHLNDEDYLYRIEKLGDNDEYN